MNNSNNIKTDSIVVYTKFDPFNIACYDISSNKIYIEEKLKNHPCIDAIIAHEMKHVWSKHKIDIVIELFGNNHISKYYFDILKVKPLWLFHWIYPFISHEVETLNGKIKWEHGVDLSRIVMIIIYKILFSILIYIKFM